MKHSTQSRQRSLAALLALALSACSNTMTATLTSPDSGLPEDRVTSRLTMTEAGERVLLQEVWFAAPVEDVWAAYTTDTGWTAWASPQAEIDLRVGGALRTHYGVDAKIGDPGTNALTIVSYVPQELLILRADLSANWPAILQRDAEHLSNVILFDRLGPAATRVRSYGVGYRAGDEYDQLLEFFTAANEMLHERLVDYVERGERWDFRSE